MNRPLTVTSSFDTIPFHLIIQHHSTCFINIFQPIWPIDINCLSAWHERSKYLSSAFLSSTLGSKILMARPLSVARLDLWHRMATVAAVATCPKWDVETRWDILRAFKSKRKDTNTRTISHSEGTLRSQSTCQPAATFPTLFNASQLLPSCQKWRSARQGPCSPTSGCSCHWSCQSSCCWSCGFSFRQENLRHCSSCSSCLSQVLPQASLTFGRPQHSMFKPRCLFVRWTFLELSSAATVPAFTLFHCFVETAESLTKPRNSDLWKYLASDFFSWRDAKPLPNLKISTKTLHALSKAPLGNSTKMMKQNIW